MFSHFLISKYYLAYDDIFRAIFITFPVPRRISRNVLMHTANANYFPPSTCVIFVPSYSVPTVNALCNSYAK